MKLGIMQPYFFPYIGYFQLINAVDEFVVYDNIEYTKKGWINRNRILINNDFKFITLPLQKDSDYLNVNERYLASTWKNERTKVLNKIKEAYRKSPEFEKVFPLVEKCLFYEDENLFNFIFNSLNLIKDYLSISTRFFVSSNTNIDESLKAQEKVIAICKARHASVYINPVGGRVLYEKADFEKNGIELFFLTSEAIEYSQFDDNFVPSLSIIDVLMFNSKDKVRSYLDNFYTLI